MLDAQAALPERIPLAHVVPLVVGGPGDERIGHADSGASNEHGVCYGIG